MILVPSNVVFNPVTYDRIEEMDIYFPGSARLLFKSALEEIPGSCNIHGYKFSWSLEGGLIVIEEKK